VLETIVQQSLDLGKLGEDDILVTMEANHAGGDRMKYHSAILWVTRLVLAVVFCANVNCALAFIVRPEAHAPFFEVRGVAGEALVRGIGILFLMWNASYPLTIWNPWRYRWLFLIVIVQQAIGVAGETWMLLTLPPGHATLAATGWRFTAFDGGGLAAMLVTFTLLRLTGRRVADQARYGSQRTACE
jgi:hypothetical protein